MSKMNNKTVNIDLDKIFILNYIVQDALFLLDSKGMIIWINKKAEELVKRNNASVNGQSIFQYLSIDDEFQRVVQDQLSKDFEREIYKTLQWINITPVPWGICGDAKVSVIVRNISETKILRDAVAKGMKTNRELEDIMNAYSDGIFVADEKGNILYMNQACEEISGVRKEVVGSTVFDLVKDGLLSKSCTVEVLNKKKRTSILQVVANRRQVLVTGTPVFDEQGNIYRVVSNTRDMTELNELKMKLQIQQNLTEQYYSELVGLNSKHLNNNKIIAKSEEMVKTLELAMRVANTDSAVLITGESGVGKDDIARFVHNESTRKNCSFMKINCAAIPQNLLESELFGYEDGAFTGAKKGGKAGLIELAKGGTLFLNEISELPYMLQAKLLQVLQDYVFMRIGGKQPIRADIRIIAASNRNLEELTKSSLFREDLYYRLNVVPIYIAPLRERPDDIFPLVSFFINKFNRKHSQNKRISPEAINILLSYSWPGNVRELENLIERMILLTSEDLIQAVHLPTHMHSRETQNVGNIKVYELIPFKTALKSIEKQLFSMAYERCGDTYKAAKALGVSQPTVVRKLQKYKCQ